MSDPHDILGSRKPVEMEKEGASQDCQLTKTSPYTGLVDTFGSY